MSSLCRIRTILGCITIAGCCFSIANAQELSTLAPLDTSGPITYFISTGEPGSGFRDEDGDLASWALAAWAQSINGAFSFSPASESSALLRIYWVPSDFGLYGEMRPILVNGRRGAEVYIRPDTDALGEQIARRSRADSLFRDSVVYLTCLHELGHALGLEHTSEFADIMYFFGFGGDIPRFFGRYRDRLNVRDDISEVLGVSEGDLAQLQALYGGRTPTN